MELPHLVLEDHHHAAIARGRTGLPLTLGRKSRPPPHPTVGKPAVRGAGHSALEKLEDLRRIQDAGKPLQLPCAVDEVEAVCAALDHRGLCLWVFGAQSPAHLDEVYAAFLAQCG
jgi:hypothetical protein